MGSFCGIECNFESVFSKNYANLKKNYTKSEQNHVKYDKFTKNFEPR